MCIRDSAHGMQKKLEAVVQEYAARASPEGNISVGGTIDCALSCEIGCSDGVHVGSVAKIIGEEQEVGVTSRCDLEGGEVIDANGNAGSFRQGHRNDWPTDRQPRVFPFLRFRQWRNHHRVQMFIPIHQLKRSIIRRVRVVPRWQEAIEWHACMTQGRMSNGTYR